MHYLPSIAAGKVQPLANKTKLSEYATACPLAMEVRPSSFRRYNIHVITVSSGSQAKFVPSCLGILQLEVLGIQPGALCVQRINNSTKWVSMVYSCTCGLMPLVQEHLLSAPIRKEARYTCMPPPIFFLQLF